MRLHVGTRRILGVGEMLLLAYLIVVMAVEVLRLTTGWPTVNDLASSPALLAQGQWWRLITSALVVNGPVIPQLVAIGALGTLAIYFGGSGTFWVSALSGHFFGTLAAYLGVAALWVADRAAAARYATDPDYGVSLIWCAALGAFAAWSWMGTRAKVRRPVHPWWAVAATLLMFVVTEYSDNLAAVEHVIAFGVGALVIATAGRSREVYRERRPLVQVESRG